MKPIFVSKPQLKVTAQYTVAKFMKPIFVSKPQLCAATWMGLH